MKKLLLISTLLLITGCSSNHFEERVMESCKVNDKESVRTQESHQYRVYTSCGTFKIEDSFYLMRFDSADLYGSIELNKKYDFKTYGTRNGFFSMFPNIISMREHNGS